MVIYISTTYTLGSNGWQTTKKSPFGRPKVCFKDLVKIDLKACKISIETWKEMANDRKNWQRMSKESLPSHEMLLHQHWQEIKKHQLYRNAKSILLRDRRMPTKHQQIKWQFRKMSPGGYLVKNVINSVSALVDWRKGLLLRYKLVFSDVIT